VENITRRIYLVFIFMSLSTIQSAQISSWFYIQKPRPSASHRLFCFPYAGGGASVFRDWFQSLPQEIEIVAIRPPGREIRFSGAPISSLVQLVQLLYQNLLPLFDKPFMFFGHSNGALASFELARLLEAKRTVGPDLVILSAKRPPHIPDPRKNISHLPDKEFLVELREFNGTPQEILQNQELMNLLIPVLRADFSLSETMTHVDNTPLKAETILFHGIRDRITKEEVVAWQDLLLKPHKLVEFSGDHFFIDSQRDELLSVLGSLLRQHIGHLNT
jgi:medium-chain acyl-[acyl-carrier-protein] hydrolase